MEYQKVKPKRFAKKGFKNAAESRFWKKYETVYAQLEPGFMTNDISFCQIGNKAYAATATASRVDIWKLQEQRDDEEDKKKKDDDLSDGEDRPEEEAKLENDTDLSPVTTISKLEDLVTAVKLRKDGQVVLCGDKLGKV